MTPALRAELCAKGREGLSIDAIREHLEAEHEFSVCRAVVKRVLKEEGLSRPIGRPANPKEAQVEDEDTTIGECGTTRLQFGGMKLIEAVLVQTGYVASLARAVEVHVENLPTPLVPSEPDTTDRDECGRFTTAYNERYRKGPDDPIGPGFASVSEKRVGLDPARLQISQVRVETLERKLYAIMVSVLLGSGQWDGMRTPRGAVLEEICGFEYMPPTLERFTTELKYAAVSSTLWETHGRLWIEQTRAWGDERYAIVVYVDATTKPIWTRHFSQSTKISSVGRVMPGLEQIAIHTGYGVPVWMATHSGRAPLVNYVPKMLGQIESLWGPSCVSRIVVIDAEGSSVPFLMGLEEGKPARPFVTRLRSAMLKNKRIFNRTNYQSYRNGDRVRVGVADFPVPGRKDATFRMRIVEMERRTTGEMTYLAASTLLDEKEWKADQLADLYFKRWPAQEADFRAVNKATKSKQMHGYGKQLVANVSVLTELEKVEGKIRGADERLARQEEKALDSQKRHRDAEKALKRQLRRLATVERDVSERVVAGGVITAKTQRLVKEQVDLRQQMDTQRTLVAKREAQLEQARGLVERTQVRRESLAEHRTELYERREIFAHDVELDSIFSVLKVGLALLVRVVLKEYLGDARMEVATFLDRVAVLPARLHIMPHLELLRFEYNHRDPEVMGLLLSQCDAINALRLPMHSGRVLRMSVDPPPKPVRPPPPGSRVGSGDRFRR